MRISHFLKIGIFLCSSVSIGHEQFWVVQTKRYVNRLVMPFAVVAGAYAVSNLFKGHYGAAHNNFLICTSFVGFSLINSAVLSNVPRGADA